MGRSILFFVPRGLPAGLPDVPLGNALGGGGVSGQPAELVLRGPF